MAHMMVLLESASDRKYRSVRLILVWLLGLIAGGYLFRCSGTGLPAPLHTAAGLPVSFIGLLATMLLPFFGVFLSCCMGAPFLLYGICFLKAVCFCFVSCGVLSAFGQAGWLLRLTFLFSDSASVLLLLLFSLTCLNGKARRPLRSACFYAALLFGAVYLDYTCITPILQRFIN